MRMVTYFNQLAFIESLGHIYLLDPLYGPNYNESRHQTTPFLQYCKREKKWQLSIAPTALVQSPGPQLKMQ